MIHYKGGRGILSGDNFVGGGGGDFGTLPILERAIKRRQLQHPQRSTNAACFALAPSSQTFQTTTNFSLLNEQDERT